MLIIVLWVAFGLVALALYFANAMSLELRTSDNGVAALSAEKAIEGAARYVSNVLANAGTPGALPDTNLYLVSGVPVGDATFWLIGRGDDATSLAPVPSFGLVDEASKLNLNTATLAMLQMLPRMPPELAAAIVDWRDSNDSVTEGGAESETYLRLTPAYRCKNAPFESVDELRMVYGADAFLLYGEDVNMNGILDRNENDGDASPPPDNMDGRIDAGLLEFVTVYSREPGSGTNGTPRLNVGAANLQQQLASVLLENLGSSRANQVLQQLGLGGGGGGGRGGAPPATPTQIRSVLELYFRSGMTADEFGLIEDRLRNPSTNGLVNVNTASEAVLSAIPGIGLDYAPAVIAARRSQQRPLISMAWLKDVLPQPNAVQAGPFLTGRSYQFTADIAAVGQHGRGYRREKFVFDTSSGTPRIVHRQDLTHLGWALGNRALLNQSTLARTFR